MNDTENALVVFQGKKIRRTWHNKEWYFSIIDIVAALTDSPILLGNIGARSKTESL